MREMKTEVGVDSEGTLPSTGQRCVRDRKNPPPSADVMLTAMSLRSAAEKAWRCNKLFSECLRQCMRFCRSKYRLQTVLLESGAGGDGDDIQQLSGKKRSNAGVKQCPGRTNGTASCLQQASWR